MSAAEQSSEHTPSDETAPDETAPAQMAPNHMAPDVQTFGVTCEINDIRGRRGYIAPVVVNAGVAYAFALLEGSPGAIPAPLLLEALVSTSDVTRARGGTGTGTAEGDEWVMLAKLGVLAILTEPELQVSCWQLPGRVRDVRLAAPWGSRAEIRTGLPQTPRALSSPAKGTPGSGRVGFWGPALRRGRDLACFFVSFNTPTTTPPTTSSLPVRSPASVVPQLHKRVGEHWYPMAYVQGAGGTSDDGVLIQLGHWALEASADIDDLRLAVSAGAEHAASGEGRGVAGDAEQR